MKRTHMLLWLAVSLSPVSCTTILSSNPQPVVVNSSPSQATVLVNGSPMGQTPMTVNLDRKTPTYLMEVHKPGYAPYPQYVSKTVDPLFFLNVLFLPGFLVDLVTGTWERFPVQVTAPLVPLATSRR
jgi:hypothetical protein